MHTIKMTMDVDTGERCVLLKTDLLYGDWHYIGSTVKGESIIELYAAGN